jgi:hypothetical protein
MNTRIRSQRGHIHLWLPVVVIVIVGAVGYYVYQAQHRPSKITDPTVKAALKKASSDLKSVNLASVKASVSSIQSTQGQIKK